MTTKEELEKLNKTISPEEKKQKSLNRRFGLVVIICLVLFAILVYEIIAKII